MNARPYAASALVLSLVSSTLSSAPAPAVDPANLDRSVKPGDDFFTYANGGWIARTEIPADRAIWSVGAMLAELTAQRTAELIAETAKGAAPEGSEARKIGDTYSTFLDEATIEAKGLEPLKPTLDRIAAIGNAGELAAYLGSTVRADVDVLNATNLHTDNVLGLWVAQDLDDPSRYVPFLLQGGIGLPDRDYYTDPSPRMEEIRGKYQAHLVAVLRLMGTAEGDAAAAAERIYALEKRLAETHATRTDSSDVLKGNNHWKREELDQKAPGLDWGAFLKAAGLDAQREFVMWQPAAVTGLTAAAREVPLATWKEYLALRAVEHVAPFLPKRVVDEYFAFYGTALSGTPKQRDRWKRAVSVTDAALGEAVGRLYVARYFPPAAKKRVEEMVKNEVTAFARRIDKLDWMTAQTKKRAKAKLAVLRVGIGYPDRWRDYSGLVVTKGDALGNAQRAELFRLRQQLAKLGGPVDRGEWVMNPQLVNAVNLPAMNALNFPAAILQPPNFDAKRPRVMDYGAIGAIIGHEICHSFDDQGALFDEKGKLENWWTKED